MQILTIDMGSSAVRAGLFGVDTATASVCLERGPASVRLPIDRAVSVGDVAEALRRAVEAVGPVAGVEVVVPACQSPSLCLLGTGEGLEHVPILTHADRRSLPQARALVERFGEDGFLAMAGNLPVPGGISLTSLLWLQQELGGALERAEGWGHLTTWLVHRLTGQRAIDPGNACFTGMLDVRSGAWNRGLIDGLGLDAGQVPTLLDGAAVAGVVTAEGHRWLGVPQGARVLVGLIDTSAALLAGPIRAGVFVHSLGTTDVLARVVGSPRPDRRWLTRAIGTGSGWLAVVTLAAGGASLEWVRRVLFSEVSAETFHAGLAGRLRGLAGKPAGDVRFCAYLGGSRLSVEQPTAGFTGLTLSTGREDMLDAVLQAYRAQSAAALEALLELGPPDGELLLTGGAGDVAAALHGAWPVGMFRCTQRRDATHAGLAGLGLGYVRAAGLPAGPE